MTPLGGAQARALRAGASMAEVQVNLLPKHQRSAQSHAIAPRIRPAVAAIAARHGARIAVAEVPAGPPVLQALVAEVYGPEIPVNFSSSRAHCPAAVGPESPGPHIQPGKMVTTRIPPAVLESTSQQASLAALRLAASARPAAGVAIAGRA